MEPTLSQRCTGIRKEAKTSAETSKDQDSPLRRVQQWSRSLTEAGQDPPLEVFRTQMDKALSNPT